MLITRKTKIPLHWVFYAQVPFVLSIWATQMSGTPFLYAMKKFIDNPAAITFLISIEVLLTTLGGPMANWFSDRIWTRVGRRKPFIIASDLGKVLLFPLIPFAPDLYTLIALKWLIGIISDLGTPNQALTMEVVPTKQRGKGAGFFQMQLNIVNLIFWGMVIGRFDDVYFMGPLQGILSISGEALMFFSAALMFVAIIIYTGFGIKEIKPPNRKRLEDERKGKENYLWLFLRGFFKDVFAKSLLPLYMLLFVGAMAGVSLGILGPLLYTEQWNYSLQDMGTNVAIGAFINIFVAIAAGYYADATSKMRVYVICLVVGLLLKVTWMFYVYAKPDNRPELWEIVLFGEFSAIAGLIAGTVSFPLILEYVERNRLGTAGAGMSLFNSVVKNGIQMAIGSYVLIWSVLFLPQAGDLVEVVFSGEKDRETVEAQIAANPDIDSESIHIEAMHRPGVDGPQSQHWLIRRNSERSAELQEERKDIENDISKWNVKLSSPFADEEDIEELKAKIAKARERIDDIEAELTTSAREFRQKLEGIFGETLYAEGNQVMGLSLDDGKMLLRLQVVEPVEEEYTEDLELGLESFEFTRVPNASSETQGLQPAIEVSPLPGEVNGIEIQAQFDPNFLAFDRAFATADVEDTTAYDETAVLMGMLRGFFGDTANAFTISDVEVTTGDQPGVIAFTLQTPEPVSAEEAKGIREGLASHSKFSEVTITGTGTTHEVGIVFDEALPPGAPPDQTPTWNRFAEAFPDNAYARETLYRFYQRVVETAAARPVFLTVARPVVEESYAERDYDYFFSVHILMILTDVLGLGVVWMIVHLERKGVIHRYGVEEDANREEQQS